MSPCAQVELSMLMVGHTHEDIDQAFRIIAEELKRRRVIKTIPDYLDAIKTAWKDENADPPHAELLMSTMHYADWLQPHV